MANNEQKKTIPLSTIPSSKLTVVLNNFIINTVNHLNKLSLNVDQNLSEFDKKMNDLEIMTTLFEAKLESLPDEIKSTFPSLQPCNLDDVNPVFSANNNIDSKSAEQKEDESNKNLEQINENNEKQGGEEEKKEEEKKEVEEQEPIQNEELSPEEELQKFLDNNKDFQNLFKMLKVGVPIISVEQKAKLNGYDMDLFNELIEKAHNAYPEKIIINKY